MLNKQSQEEADRDAASSVGIVRGGKRNIHSNNEVGPFPSKSAEEQPVKVGENREGEGSNLVAYRRQKKRPEGSGGLGRPDGAQDPRCRDEQEERDRNNSNKENTNQNASSPRRALHLDSPDTDGLGAKPEKAECSLRGPGDTATPSVREAVAVEVQDCKEGKEEEEDCKKTALEKNLKNISLFYLAPWQVAGCCADEFVQAVCTQEAHVLSKNERLLWGRTGLVLRILLSLKQKHSWSWEEVCSSYAAHKLGERLLQLHQEKLERLQKGSPSPAPSFRSSSSSTPLHGTPANSEKRPEQPEKKQQEVKEPEGKAQAP